MINIKKYHLAYKILFSILICIIFIFVVYPTTEVKFKEENLNKSIASSTHQAYFFDSSTFTDAIEKVKYSDKNYPKPIIGGVVPHHLLPSFIIADFFKNLAKQKPETIILIGPNHYELGEEPILSSTSGWETPFGIVEPDIEFVRELNDKKILYLDEEVLDKEHSIGSIVPFIKYYIPDAKVVPIILSGNLEMEQIKNMVETLVPRINKKTVILASMDFSHYQDKSQAEINDEITLKLMRAKDYEKIINLNSAYVDSPPSIIALLMVMEKKGIDDFDLIYHTNAGEILHSQFYEVTSYFSFAF
ncbi:MAG: AmmeMemoRadiSam system protein B [Candidatus Paceibacterota bacterium]